MEYLIRPTATSESVGLAVSTHRALRAVGVGAHLARLGEASSGADANDAAEAAGRFVIVIENIPITDPALKGQDFGRVYYQFGTAEVGRSIHVARSVVANLGSKGEPRALPPTMEKAAALRTVAHGGIFVEWFGSGAGVPEAIARGIVATEHEESRLIEPDEEDDRATKDTSPPRTAADDPAPLSPEHRVSSRPGRKVRIAAGGVASAAAAATLNAVAVMEAQGLLHVQQYLAGAGGAVVTVILAVTLYLLRCHTRTDIEAIRAGAPATRKGHG